MGNGGNGHMEWPSALMNQLSTEWEVWEAVGKKTVKLQQNISGLKSRQSVGPIKAIRPV